MNGAGNAGSHKRRETGGANISYFFPLLLLLLLLLGWLSSGGRNSNKVRSGVFALANNRGAQRRSTPPCGAGDKIPATPAAALQAVIQKSENEREEGKKVQCRGDPAHLAHLQARTVQTAAVFQRVCDIY